MTQNSLWIVPTRLTALFGFLVLAVLVPFDPSNTAGAADLELKSQSLGKAEKIEPVKKLGPPAKPAQKELKKVTPKRIKTKPAKTKTIKPAKVSPGKAPAKTLSKPAPDKLKKLDVAPKDGGAPAQVKNTAVQPPANMNQNLKKDLLKPSHKTLVKDLKTDGSAGVVSPGAAGLQIDPDSNLSSQLAAPTMKELVVKPEIQEAAGLSKDLGKSMEPGLVGKKGNSQTSFGHNSNLRKGGFTTAKDLVGNPVLAKGSIDRGAVLEGGEVSFDTTHLSGGEVVTNDGKKVMSESEIQRRWGDGAKDAWLMANKDYLEERYDILIVKDEVYDQIKAYHASAGGSEDPEAGQEGGGVPEPELARLTDKSGEWKSGFAGLPYYEYYDDSETESSSQETEDSEDQFNWAWEDDEGTSEDADTETGGEGDASADDNGESEQAAEPDSADEDCPEGSEGCGETSGDEAGEDTRTVDGGQDNLSDCATPGACDEGRIESAAEENSGGSGTIRTAEDEGKGGPLNRDPDTSPANGTLRLANEEGIGGELVRGDNVLQGAADGTLRLPEGEDDEGGGTPQVADGSGGGIGNPGVVTRGTVEPEGVNVRGEMSLRTEQLNIDAESLENLTEQAGQ